MVYDHFTKCLLYDDQEAAHSRDTRAFRQKANAESLQGALDKLPDEFREVIVLHDLEGLAYKEIATVVGIPIGTVMSRLARARGRLRAEIIATTIRESRT